MFARPMFKSLKGAKCYGISKDDDHHWVLSKVQGSKLITDES